MFAFARENVRSESIDIERTEEEWFEDEADTPVADTCAEFQTYHLSESWCGFSNAYFAYFNYLTLNVDFLQVHVTPDHNSYSPL